MIRFETRAQRHDTCNVQIVHGEIQVQKRCRLWQELCQCDGAERGEACRRHKEPLEGRIESKGSSERLNLGASLGTIAHPSLEATYPFKTGATAWVFAQVQRFKTAVVFLRDAFNIIPLKD